MTAAPVVTFDGKPGRLRLVTAGGAGYDPSGDLAG
jgi:hypothetical protein